MRGAKFIPAHLPQVPDRKSRCIMTLKTHAHNSEKVKPQSSEPYLTCTFGSDALVFPGLSHWEMLAIPIERRRQMFAEAVAARERRIKQRLPEKDVEAVFNDLEFDPLTGEVFP